MSETIFDPTSTAQPSAPRQDTRALWGGILFSLGFTLLIWAAGARLEQVRLLPDQGPAWYLWKLPHPTFWTHFTAWGLYLAHQLAIWGFIRHAQTRVNRYTTGLHPVNRWALATNAVFILLHFAQTHIWYDGLAQDTPIWSSQGSVIVMLVWILLMENNRRGLFFGRKVKLGQEIIRFARKYHGYVFAWAAIYTFWFHPMVATSGHLIGFFYMFLLMLQGSLFFTRAHTNRFWTFTLEIMVLAHGALVAVMQGNGLWTMFAFGFGGIFIITQMAGLGLSRLARWGIVGLYVALTLWVYSQKGWQYLNEIVRIPMIEYLAVFVLAGLIGLGLWIKRLVVRRSQASSESG